MTTQQRGRFQVTQARETEIRADMARWAGRTAPQLSPMMHMCMDLLALLDDARDINARMMAEKLAQDPEYQAAVKEATA